MEEEIKYLENLIEVKTFNMGCIDRKYDEECRQAYWAAEYEVRLLQNILECIKYEKE